MIKMCPAAAEKAERPLCNKHLLVSQWVLAVLRKDVTHSPLTPGVKNYNNACG
jgi:hypothetical protein